jgi:hypothetical protein
LRDATYWLAEKHFNFLMKPCSSHPSSFFDRDLPSSSMNKKFIFCFWFFKLFNKYLNETI